MIPYIAQLYEPNSRVLLFPFVKSACVFTTTRLFNAISSNKKGYSCNIVTPYNAINFTRLESSLSQPSVRYVAWNLIEIPLLCSTASMSHLGDGAGGALTGVQRNVI